VLGSFFLALALFSAAFVCSYVSLDPTTARWFSGFGLILGIISYAFGLNEVINMLFKPFMHSRREEESI
jgi:ABC-type multidrug transport system permease subunit